MAQYELDVTSAATAAQFVRHPDSSSGVTVEPVMDGGTPAFKVIVAVEDLIWWEGHAPAENMEVLCRIRGTVNSSSRRKGPAVRVIPGAPVNAIHYRGGWRGSTLHQINTEKSGSASGLNEFTGPSALSYHWRRLRVHGSSVQLKVWSGDLSDEPSSPQVSITNTTVQGAGYMGFSGNDSGDMFVSHLYVATDGDVAGPAGPAERRRSPLLLTPW